MSIDVEVRLCKNIRGLFADYSLNKNNNKKIRRSYLSNIKN